MKNKMLQRIKVGAAYLDVKIKNWRKKINPEMLDLSSGDYCILGQLDNDYDNAKKELGLSDQMVYDLGFHVSPTGKFDYHKKKWNHLTNCWKKVLKK